MADSSDSFQIILDGVSIGSYANSGEEKIPAEVNESNPAVFTFDPEEGLLESGDYYLGRYAVEPRSLSPKSLYWFKKGGGIPKEAIQKTEIEESDGTFSIKNGNARLAVVEGNVVADLLGSSPATVKITEA